MLTRMIGYWDTRPWPDDIREVNETWHVHGPEDITVYDRAEAIDFISKVYGQREVDAFAACNVPAMQSDLFRLLEIVALGGFYADMSIGLLRRPDEFLSPGADLVLYRRWHGRIVNNLFSAEAGNAVLAEILARVLRNIEARIANDVWHVTGPKVWNEVTDTGRLTEGIRVVEHAAIAGKTVVFNQDLFHKKDGRHWSDVQRSQSIYRN
ncbi:glycosyltransferase [Roseicyclus persicicus]|uniref:Uncharacterized protein n=1 Tax=Roseicyclus persicicus TaxID=2650661 RepID=A0A7X6H268_9RHOB|nr:glycosyltransferase [Roseibacterium persicicum]NKX45446.1 hypothetical protein [Roseibacterium persicicum]